MDEPHPIWISAPDARSAALLMEESIGRLRTQLVQCSGSRWRVVILPHGARLPDVSEVIALVRCWLSRLGLSEAVLHLGARSFTVRCAPDPLSHRRYRC